MTIKSIRSSESHKTKEKTRSEMKYGRVRVFIDGGDETDYKVLMISKAILASKTLSPKARLVAMIIHSVGMSKNDKYPSHNAVGKYIGLSKEDVEVCFTELSKVGTLSQSDTVLTLNL